MKLSTNHIAKIDALRAAGFSYAAMAKKLTKEGFTTSTGKQLRGHNLSKWHAYKLQTEVRQTPVVKNTESPAPTPSEVTSEMVADFIWAKLPADQRTSIIARIVKDASLKL